jgi:hypothetical protein
VFKLLWKNLVNSPKFYLDFFFMNINLVGHGFMSKCVVSIHEPNDLVLNKDKGLEFEI